MTKLDFISVHEKSYKVRRMCQALCVSRSWFYRRRKNADARLAKQGEEAQLGDNIGRILKPAARPMAVLAFIRPCAPKGWGSRNIAFLS
jgi:hypothetical protein